MLNYDRTVVLMCFGFEYFFIFFVRVRRNDIACCFPLLSKNFIRYGEQVGNKQKQCIKSQQIEEKILTYFSIYFLFFIFSIFGHV